MKFWPVVMGFFLTISQPIVSHKAPPIKSFVKYKEASQELARNLKPLFGKKEPVLLVFGDQVPLGLRESLKEALSREGIRLCAEGKDLYLFLKAREDFQKALYEPEALPWLKRARWIVAVAGVPQGKSLLVRTALFEVSERAGTTPPKGVVSVIIRLARPLFMARGEGYCNRRLDPSLWRYSALKAAELEARVSILEKYRDFSITSQKKEKARVLEEETVRLYGKWGGNFRFLRVAEYFDEKLCRSEVVLELEEGP